MWNATFRDLQPLRKAVRRCLRLKCGPEMLHLAEAKVGGKTYAQAGEQQRWWHIAGSGKDDVHFYLLSGGVLQKILQTNEFEAFQSL